MQGVSQTFPQRKHELLIYFCRSGKTLIKPICKNLLKRFIFLWGSFNLTKKKQTNQSVLSGACLGDLQAASVQKACKPSSSSVPHMVVLPQDLLTLGEAEGSKTFTILEDGEQNGGSRHPWAGVLGRSHHGPTLGSYRRAGREPPTLPQRRTFPPSCDLASFLLIFPNSYFEVGSRLQSRTALTSCSPG